jgi:hypothetical protein
MNTKDYYKSTSAYIKASETSPFTATITDVIESVDFHKKPCLVIVLSNDTKISLTYFTNNSMEKLYGTETDNWIGKNISVTTDDGISEKTGDSYHFFKIEAADQSRPPQAEVPPIPDLDDLPFG